MTGPPSRPFHDPPSWIAAIDPYGRCGDHMLGVAEVICDHERAGIFLSPCRHSGLGEETLLASAILRRVLADDPPVVFGTVAWLGGVTADGGLQVSTSDEQ